MVWEDEVRQVASDILLSEVSFLDKLVKKRPDSNGIAEF